MIDALRARWRKDLFSDHAWKLDRFRSPASGALDGVWLEPRADAPFGAYLKPTVTLRRDPVAAREKIAADLAFDLRIPAVPVLLCNSHGRFGAVQEECCVSLVTHAQTTPWTFMYSVASLGSRQLAAVLWGAAASALSRIATFDLWIGNGDRANRGNVIFGEDQERPSRSGFFAVDHSLAFGYEGGAWAGNGWSSMGVVPFPQELRQALDEEVMLQAAEEIRSLADASIVECVHRIPEQYMDEMTRNTVVNGLIGRKELLAAFVLQTMSAQP